MQKHNNMPWWVFLAFSSIETRQAALWLIRSSVIFTLYCIPWMNFFPMSWIKQVFLLEDWEWFAMMLPMTFWYWQSLRWVDKNQGWQADHSNRP